MKLGETKDKYSNGKYKTTSNEQNKVSLAIFTAFKDNKHHAQLEYMGTEFNQDSGNCEYTYYFVDSHTVYYILINRDGLIIQSGFTTK